MYLFWGALCPRSCWLSSVTQLLSFVLWGSSIPGTLGQRARPCGGAATWSPSPWERIRTAQKQGVFPSMNPTGQRDQKGSVPQQQLLVIPGGQRGPGVCACVCTWRRRCKRYKSGRGLHWHGSLGGSPGPPRVPPRLPPCTRQGQAELPCCGSGAPLPPALSKRRKPQTCKEKLKKQTIFTR